MLRKIDVEPARPQAAELGSTPWGCGLIFESVVVHGGYAANGQKKTPRSISYGAFRIDSGGDLLSHTKSHAVPSALRSLTSEFGMGSGVASSQ